jgi:excisionase family DNA binding protein
MTIRKFAETFALSHSTIYRLHHAGKLTIHKVGRKSVIAAQDAEFLVTLARKDGGARG